MSVRLWWRCLWMDNVLTSVERVDPPPGAAVTCFDIPHGHGCYVLETCIEDALAKARENHPPKPVSMFS